MRFIQKKRKLIFESPVIYLGLAMLEGGGGGVDMFGHIDPLIIQNEVFDKGSLDFHPPESLKAIII